MASTQTYKFALAVNANSQAIYIICLKIENEHKAHIWHIL